MVKKQKLPQDVRKLWNNICILHSLPARYVQPTWFTTTGKNGGGHL